MVVWRVARGFWESGQRVQDHRCPSQATRDHGRFGVAASGPAARRSALIAWRRATTRSTRTGHTSSTAMQHPTDGARERTPRHPSQTGSERARARRLLLALLPVAVIVGVLAGVTG